MKQQTVIDAYLDCGANTNFFKFVEHGRIIRMSFCAREFFSSVQWLYYVPHSKVCMRLIYFGNILLTLFKGVGNYILCSTSTKVSC